MLVPDQIARAARRYGDATALICGTERLGFAEAHERSNRLANALLALGLDRGDRVLCLLENSIRCVEVDFALAKAGLIRVSINPRSTLHETAYMLGDSGARTVIFGANFGELIDELRQQQPDISTWIRVEGGPAPGAGTLDYQAFLASGGDEMPEAIEDPETIYSLMYTSGTSGRPKGVMLSHRAILQVAYNLLLEVGPQTVGEKLLLMQPLSHGAGFFILPWLMRGGVSVIMKEFVAAEALDLARDHGIQTIKLVPTMLQRMLRCRDFMPEDFPELRQVIYGASPMPTEALRDAIAKFGPKLVQVYGQTEAPVTLTCLAIEDHGPGVDSARLASAGAPWTTVEVVIVDSEGRPVAPGEIGEITVRAPHVMSGYWNLPELSARILVDGWLRTNDMGRMDEQGFVHLVGRRDEMIITGGYNVAPREVEEVLYLHPTVAEAAVVGTPDPEWGSAITAYVVVKQAVEESEIIAFVRSRIGFKRPKRVYFLSELPKNGNGKIQKSALKPELASNSDKMSVA